MLTTFFAVCGAKYSGIVGNCLKSLAELRSSANFTFTNELDYVIGKAVRTMGPEVVLSHVPLQITGKEESFWCDDDCKRTGQKDKNKDRTGYRGNERRTEFWRQSQETDGKRGSGSLRPSARRLQQGTQRLERAGRPR